MNVIAQARRPSFVKNGENERADRRAREKNLVRPSVIELELDVLSTAKRVRYDSPVVGGKIHAPHYDLRRKVKRHDPRQEERPHVRRCVGRVRVEELRHGAKKASNGRNDHDGHHHEGRLLQQRANVESSLGLHTRDALDELDASRQRVDAFDASKQNVFRGAKNFDRPVREKDVSEARVDSPAYCRCVPSSTQLGVEVVDIDEYLLVKLL